MKPQNIGTKGRIRFEKILILLMIAWVNAGPCFDFGDLPDGEWGIVNDEYGEVVQVNLNKIKDWSKVPGIKMHWM